MDSVILPDPDDNTSNTERKFRQTSCFGSKSEANIIFNKKIVTDNINLSEFLMQSM